MIRSFVIVYIDHAAKDYLLTKYDPKPKLIRWVLLLQEFEFDYVKPFGLIENRLKNNLICVFGLFGLK